ncbi:hypothetical protein CIHG_09599 [Coccidioides immitis H538.4]|uniref:Uncharacterized protein n=2 Tax=Coccidioides immitis TaxID=5501 RepID=A0A0J8S673_COCIT|nr:hypothetical protein CIRG_03896 [Coccidioides immitis RMSCC 2394]KMU91859.1 hypothetical protein CIHG_09599 [Coccidioides immitis H538.4]
MWWNEAFVTRPLSCHKRWGSNTAIGPTKTQGLIPTGRQSTGSFTIAKCRYLVRPAGGTFSTPRTVPLTAYLSAHTNISTLYSKGPESSVYGVLSVKTSASSHGTVGTSYFMTHPPFPPESLMCKLPSIPPKKKGWRKGWGFSYLMIVTVPRTCAALPIYSQFRVETPTSWPGINPIQRSHV